jgi:hypothetical protein
VLSHNHAVRELSVQPEVLLSLHTRWAEIVRDDAAFDALPLVMDPAGRKAVEHEKMMSE